VNEDDVVAGVSVALSATSVPDGGGASGRCASVARARRDDCDRDEDGPHLARCHAAAHGRSPPSGP